MDVELGQIKAIFRYPVKSMAGVQMDSASLGWHGLEGDRRYAFRRVGDPSGFPWLTASKLRELLLFKPFGRAGAVESLSPTHVRTPEGRELELHGAELRADISRRHGAEVELMQLKHGVFDEACISVISLATIQRIAEECGRSLEVPRFRPNLVIDTFGGEPFAEDDWLGKSLAFGDDDESPSLNVTTRDERCVMINLDPETAQADAAVMKTVARLNQNFAGVYATVIRTGKLTVGQKLYLKHVS